MENRSVTLQRLTYVLVSSFLLIHLLIVAQELLIPLAFGLMFTFVLLPICQFYERLFPHRVAAILLTFLSVLIPLSGLGFFFGYEFMELVNGLPSVGERLVEVMDQIILWLRNNLNLEAVDINEWLRNNLSMLISGPLGLVATSLTSSTTLLAGILLAFLYTFFFLLYRSSFHQFFIYQFGEKTRGHAIRLITIIRKLLQEYLIGLGLVILILGVLNSLGLWLIGVDYALFWGFLAGFLAVIPYIGTTLGGTLPFLYSLLTADSLWQPLAIVGLYVAIQQIEGNFITPKVVGSSVRINPLAAIASLFVGGMIWGIPGMILAIPVMAALRVVFSNIDLLKPYGQLLSDKLYDNEEMFEKVYDQDRYRIVNFFKNQEEEETEEETAESNFPEKI